MRQTDMLKATDPQRIFQLPGAIGQRHAGDFHLHFGRHHDDRPGRRGLRHCGPQSAASLIQRILWIRNDVRSRRPAFFLAFPEERETRKRRRDILRRRFFWPFYWRRPASASARPFFDPLLILLGDTPSLNPYSVPYGRVLVAGSPVFVFSSFLQAFVRNDGAPKLAMAGVISGGVTNVILDYVFIFPLGQGMAGAALATVMGTCLTVLILCTHFFSKENHLKLAGGFSLKRAFAVALQWPGKLYPGNVRRICDLYF